MIQNNGKVTCDAEVKRKNGTWGNCDRRAVCESVTIRYGITLHWCEVYQDRATRDGRQLVKVMSK